MITLKNDKNCLLFYLKSPFKIYFEIYDVTAWLTMNYNIHTQYLTQYLNNSRSKGNQTMKFGQLIEYPKRNIFL